MTRLLKIVIALAALAAIGAIGGVVVVGRHFAEPTVVADPYEEGLHYDERHHARDAAAVGARAPPRCDLGRTPCAQTLGGVTVTLDVTPRPPRAMSELLFTVRVSPPEAVAGVEGTVALEMPGMYMGDNRVRLAPATGGSWQGKGVVVRCPSGRRGWTARLALPAPGQPDGRLVASFPLEVVE